MATTRTTLMLERRRLMELKRLAAEQGRTLSAVVDEVLRVGLTSITTRHKPRHRKPLPTFDMGMPAVNVADREQLYDAMESTPANALPR